MWRKKRRAYYEAHSCAAYLDWIYSSDTQYNQQVFEQVLRKAVARCPDKPAAEAKPAADKKAPRKKRPSSTTGMGSIGSLGGPRAVVLPVQLDQELQLQRPRPGPVV
jgi:hypothetical protein